MSDQGELSFDLEGRSFESLSQQNGMLYWLASDLFRVLGYSDYAPNMKPLQQAMQVCISLGLDTTEHFRELRHDVGGKSVKDFKLSRFACYIVSMNSDVKKKPVAMAQAYFAGLAEAFQQVIANQEAIERVSLRAEITIHEKSLGATAAGAGVQNYAFFQAKGYMGLYNMRLDQIKDMKDVPQKDVLFDYMGPEELGANIFRITQTEAKIRRENIKGQDPLERAAFSVGREVRDTIRRVGGTLPEHLPARENIKNIKSDLKKTNKGFLKADKVKGLPGYSDEGDE